MSDTCKRSSLVNLETLRWLYQWLFERKHNNIIKRYSENKYAVNNGDSKPFV
jgi:hypothetical protein